MGNRINDSVISAIEDIVGVVRHLVDNPDKVEINIRRGPYRVVVELFTNSTDVGQVVGKNGHVITSFRSLLAAFAGKNNIEVNLDYITEQDNARMRDDRPRGGFRKRMSMG